MNRQKIKEIIKFSLYKSIQNRWFIIFNIISLISAILIINWGNVSNLFKKQDESNIFEIAVLDNNNLLYDKFENSFSGDKRYNVTKIFENNYTTENIPKDFAVVEIITDEVECFKTTIISREGINVDIYNPIRDSLSIIRNEMLEEKYNVSSEISKVFQSGLSVDRIMLSVDTKDSDTKEYMKLFSSALTYIIAVIIFSKMANEISQEKQSKSTEYILTTVSEKEYLFAKIFANISILLLQGILLLSYYFIGVLIVNISKSVVTDLSLSMVFSITTVSKDIILYVLALIVYNVLTLILLSIILAAFVAKTASNNEAGNAISIIIFIMMVAYVITLFIITPYSEVKLWLYILSCLPVLSVYFVPAMMVVGQATIWQIVASLILLIISIPVCFDICAKIFKNGILDYTKAKKQKMKNKGIEEERKELVTKRTMKNIGFVIGIGILIYIGTQTLFSFVGEIVLSSLFKCILNESEITLVLQMFLQIISLGIAAMFVLAYVDNSEALSVRKKFTFKQKVKIVFIAVMMIFALQYFLSILLYPVIGLDYDTTDLFDVDNSSRLFSKIILVLSIAVTPGIFEELFFRKAVIDFTSKYGKKFALLFSALLFGMLHMNLSQGIFAFLIGIIFGIIYLYTGDIKLTMIVHFINNGVAALVIILPEIWGIAFMGVFLICLIIGLILFIVMLSKRELRNKILGLTKLKIPLIAIKDKYKYIFAEYVFDVAIVLVILMSILTEKILR